MKKITMSAIALTTIFSSFTTANADGINILDDVQYNAQIRTRLEVASDQGKVGDRAQALTNRLHLKLSANLFGIENLKATLGAQVVNDFGYNHYNSKMNNQNQYDVILDPEFGMLSEASLDYTSGKTLFHAGRSQVKLDNQRFIGTVGWRQNERSYDTLFIANNSIPGLSLLGAWVYGYQGVGPKPGTQDMSTTDTNSVLLHAKYSLSDSMALTAYDYMLANIHDTYGIALTGKTPTTVPLKYRLEVAMQKDASMSIHQQTPTTGKADANYFNVDLSTKVNNVIIGANYELQSGSTGTDGKTAFTTPLGTNHKFNGWADKFLTTPTGGLEDINIRLGYVDKGFGKLLGFYHIFSSDKNMQTATGAGDDLGTEFDAVYVNKIPGFTNLTGLIKGAYYMGGDVTGYDKDKKVAWAQLDYKF